MADPRFIDVLVDDNPACEGCALRFKAEDEPRPVRRVRWHGEDGRSLECAVSGWVSGGDGGGGAAAEAWGVTVEDSGSGAAVLVYGGDWGVRLAPLDGGPAFHEPYLRISPEDVLG